MSHFASSNMFGQSPFGGGQFGPGGTAPWEEPLPDAPDLPALYNIPTSGLQFLHITGLDEFVNVPEWGDDSGNFRVLSSSSTGDDPTFSATAIGGTRPGIQFAGGQLTNQITPSEFSFLHGDGATLVMYLHPTGTLIGQCVVTTRTTLGSAEPGILIGYDGNVNSRFYAQQYNASAIAINVVGANGSAPPNNPYRFIFRVASSESPDGEIRLNGSSYATANYTAAATSAIPFRGPRYGIGTGLTGLNNLTGSIGVVAAYNRRLSDAECLIWEAALATLNSQRTQLTILGAGDSKMAGAQSCRRKLWMRASRSTGWHINYVGSQSPAGNFPLPDGAHEGIAGNTIEQLTARIPSFADCTDLVIDIGTNNMGNTVADSLVAYGAMLDAAKLRYPTGTRIWCLAVSYGNGSTPNLTLAGNAGTFNAALVALCAQKQVHFVDIHAGNWPWVPSLYADSVGHATPAGGDAIGNTLADSMGIGADTPLVNPTRSVIWNSIGTAAFVPPNEFWSPIGDWHQIEPWCWGAGGGGTTAVGPGGGGAHARGNSGVLIPGNSYPSSTPAGAVANADGANCTFNTNAIVAMGGRSGTNGSTGGTVAGSTGTTKFAGGNGTPGAGTTAGGGGAGSGAAGVSITGGTAEGGSGLNGTGGRNISCGGGSTAGGQVGGARGEQRWVYDTPQVAGFPQRREHIAGRSAAASTSHVITMPANVEVGDTIEVDIGIDLGGVACTVSEASGLWTKTIDTADSTTACKLVLYAKVADGTDSLTVTTSTSVTISWIATRISHGAMPEATVASGTSLGANPPNHIPTAGAANRMYRITAVIDAASTTVNSIPNYVNAVVVYPQQDASVILISAWRFANSASEDPVTLGTGSEQWVAATISEDYVP